MSNLISKLKYSVFVAVLSVTPYLSANAAPSESANQNSNNLIADKGGGGGGGGEHGGGGGGQRGGGERGFGGGDRDRGFNGGERRDGDRGFRGDRWNDNGGVWGGAVYNIYDDEGDQDGFYDTNYYYDDDY